MIDLSGKVAIVPGASGGIGSAVAEVLAECGADLAMTYRSNETKAREVLARVQALGVRARMDRLDVKDSRAIKAWTEEVIAGYGKVDILANCLGWSGHTSFQLFIDQDPDNWEDVIDVELMSVIRFSSAVVKHMIDRGSGRIIAVGSDSSKGGESGAAVSAAARAGDNAFSKSLAREVGRYGITVNTVCPGPIDSPVLDNLARSKGMGGKIVAALIRAVPMKRVGTPREVANVVAFLASDEASFVTGQAISVSGGLTMQ